MRDKVVSRCYIFYLELQLEVLFGCYMVCYDDFKSEGILFLHQVLLEYTALRGFFLTSQC